MAFDANDLSPHEHFVVERTRLGEVADFSPMSGPGGAKPAIRAGFLRKLMLSLDPEWRLTSAGVRIKGARIDGALDLTDCSGAGGAALCLDECEIADVIDVRRARVARLALLNCRVAKLVGAHAAIDGALDLSGSAPIGEAGAESFVADLQSARIGGDVIARGAHLGRVTAGDAVLMLDGANVGGDVLLDEGFEALGAVSLASARIAGALRCDASQLMNRSDDAKSVALNARGAEIGGGVKLNGKMKAEGVLDFFGVRVGGDFDLGQSNLRNDMGVVLCLTNARISGQLTGAGKLAGQVQATNAAIGRNFDWRGIELTHAVTPRGDSFATALDAAGLSVGGAMLLQGANIKGEVFLADARIAGYLAFGGGRFINSGGWAVRAPNVRVGGNLTIKIDENGYAPHGLKTVVEGGMKFDRAHIEGALSWLNLEMRGPGPAGAKGAVFSFADAEIEGPLQANGLVTQADARIDASGARCAALNDDLKTGWSADAALDLEGFAYARIDNSAEKWSQRLAWLKRSKRDGVRFSPQPFGEAARAYARCGRREDARRISLAQHDLNTAKGANGPITWALSSLFGLTAGYGLAPLRVVRALALFLAIGVAGVLTMNAQGALVQPSGAPCNGAIEPALYAIDVALPVIDLGQESRCAPGRTAAATLSPGSPVGHDGWRLFEGAALWKWAHALYAILGAILSALAVITFSGVMKPKDD
ncbi:MAG: hypothetical protein QM759_05965 [Terricaulis sp.]